MLSNVVINLARDALNDVAEVVWSDADLLSYLNDATLAIVNIRPDANSVIANVALAAGSLQTLPAGGRRLLDVMRNVTGGGAIQRTERAIIDALNPDWHGIESTTVRAYVYDDRTPKYFWVFPAIPSGQTPSVELMYAAQPTVITNPAAENFPLDDSYAPAAVEWVLYRAWSSDDESSPNYQRAQAKYQSFLTLLGQKTQADSLVSPSNPGGTN